MADPVYLALLGSAEYFRTSSPPNYRAAIQCLQAILTIRLPPLVEAKIHLYLGRLYIQHTTNIDMASMHLDKAVRSKLRFWRTGNEPVSIVVLLSVSSRSDAR